MITLNENDLNSRVVCSWMPAPEVDELFNTCVGTLDWALQERYDGSVPTLESIRARFVHLWQKDWGDRPQIDQDYWRGPRAAVRFGTKLYKFLLHYGCLKPFEPYTLDLTWGRIETQPGRIEGMSAIVEEPKGKYHPQHAFALDVRVIQPKILYLPDYRGFARWLAMQRQWDDDLGLLHLPMLFGSEWSEMQLDRGLVEKWLGAIMRQAGELPTYPVAGAHCKTCPAPCREVFRGSNDHSRKGRLTQVSGV